MFPSVPRSRYLFSRSQLSHRCPAQSQSTAGQLPRESRAVSRGSRVRSSLRRPLVRALVGRCRSALWAAPPPGTAPGEAGDSRPMWPCAAGPWPNRDRGWRCAFSAGSWRRGRCARCLGRYGGPDGGGRPWRCLFVYLSVCPVLGTRTKSADRAGLRAAGGYSAQGEDSSESSPCSLRAVLARVPKPPEWLRNTQCFARLCRTTDFLLCLVFGCS